MSLEYKAPKLRPSIAMDQLKNRKLGSVKRERRSERPHRARLKMPGSQDGGAWSVERVGAVFGLPEPVPSCGRNFELHQR